ncbi:MAG: hydrogenase iron-sulfur subunit [Acidobacteria bacterium]|nr:hydrogenase iron-sulfur subunit [Acidobacteriota bacterium]
MSKKLGVYVCGGCGIEDCLDLRKLTDLAASECRAPVVRTSPAFCLEDARMIREDVERQGVDGVVIAACSPRVNTEVFSFPSAVVERVNIREQVAWSHPPRHDETQSLAHDYVRMGVVRAQKATAPIPYTEANERTILVVGGGVTGITAALDAALAGFSVVVVEREPVLGGYARRLHRRIPSRPPYRDPQPVDIEASIRRLESLRNIRVHKGAEVTEISGQPGRFDVTIRSGEHLENATVGAIVVATGWKPGDTASFESYGLGRFPHVVTSVTLEEMAAKGRIVRPSDGGPVNRVAIAVCDGPGDARHLPYEGNVSCLVALKQALYIRELCPDAIVYLFYGDMQAPGQYEYFYKRVQGDPGVFFSRGEVRSVSEEADHKVVMEVHNTALGGAVQVSVDLLIVSTDMVPASLDPASSGSLNLRYLQGKDLPTTSAGFVDSNFICFPYETRRTGIYSAGAVRQATTLAACAQDGTAAALKAIQCIENSSAGAAVHPRVGDLSFPKFFMQKCTSCGRCSQECPFGALEVDAKNHPVLDANRCRRCGICMGACPVQIISFDDYSVDMLSSMIRAVDIPEDGEDRPRILALACENDAYPALDMAGIARLQYSAFVRVLPVRCLGSVNSVLIADAVSRGFDGVMLMGCKAGEDYQCHFIRGSELLATRMQNVRETLDRLALEAERVHVMEVAISDSAEIPAMLERFVQTVRQVGPNPLKGF